MSQDNEITSVIMRELRDEYAVVRREMSGMREDLRAMREELRIMNMRLAISAEERDVFTARLRAIDEDIQALKNA